MGDVQRRNVGWLLLFLAAIAGGVGFLVGKAATDSYRDQPPGMWVAYGAAGLLVLGAIIVWSSAGTHAPTRPTASPMTPGWYDDPDSPKLLRYWDGSEWTQKTANKG
jgi:H+/Cl- antiporter ClcA